MNTNLNSLILPAVVFVFLTFIHFFSDFIFQSHAEAMVKHNHFWVRTKHCAIYTAFFLPFFLYIHLGLWKTIACSLVLFVSHHIEDTYIPVVLWAKYIRRPPEMNDVDSYTGFKDFASTPLGKILMIAIDQIVHISFLWVVAFIVVA